jgi:hypothetical protein
MRIHADPDTDPDPKPWLKSFTGTVLTEGSRYRTFRDASFLRLFYFFNKVIKVSLKVLGNDKEGGSGRWQMIGIGLGPW